MRTKNLKVSTKNKKYSIIIGSNLFNKFRKVIKPYTKSKKVFIITDENINKFYSKKINQANNSEDLDVEIIIIKPGEKQKNFKIINILLTKLLEKGISRNDTIIAFGGGVVGDISGFVASIVLRGVNYIQIPTTLLSQVDSSVGGKTGVNSIHGKNLVGSFYQPSVVFIDIDFLKTLPEREMRAGYAEIFKYGLIQDAKFLNWLLKNGKNILKKHNNSLIHSIYQSCKCKALIVSKDEKENNIRALLNFGHTFGHVIEQANEYKKNLNHGESVAIGMIMALKLCMEMKLISQQEFQDIYFHFKSLKLSTSIPQAIKKKLTLKKFLNVMSKDKKVFNNKIKLILLKKIGNAYQTNEFKVNLLEKVINTAIK